MTGSSAATRYESLDAIRGVAVMGILAMNIIAFALPISAYFNPAAGGPPSPGDLAAWAFNFVLVDSKMRVVRDTLGKQQAGHAVQAVEFAQHRHGARRLLSRRHRVTT